jgi:BirA family transcriptional regulator, biotin operon repressor / biotin---[acetyl-CoA-carboxylase] ligase
MALADPRIDALVAHGPWTDVRHHEVVTSTQDVALAALAEGASPELVVVADAQTAGRGRRGRAWTDAVRTGSGTPTSMAVTATWQAGSDAGLVPLAAGLAVADAFGAAGAAPVLKWPNDVLLEGRKAAGILVERHNDWLLIGCGLDLDWRDVGPPSRDWTSLAEALGGRVDRVDVLVNLLRALAFRLEEPAGHLLADYRGRCGTLGREIRVSLPGGEVVEGRATDVDAAGRLAVATASGVRTVAAGDVVHLR